MPFRIYSFFAGLLITLVALPGVVPHAAAQTLSNLEVVAITSVTPPATASYNADPGRFTFPTFTLSATTDSQTVSIGAGGYLHYVCADKNDTRPGYVAVANRQGCRLVSTGPPTKIKLTQDEIANGGIMWHVFPGLSVLSVHWIPIPGSSNVTLTPAFASGTNVYTADIPSNTDSLRITPTAGSGTIEVSANSGSATTVSSGVGHSISPLNVRTNTVTVTVSSTTTYTVTLSRLPKLDKPNVTVTPLTDTLQVSWDAVTNATSYKVQWKSGDDDYDSATREETTTNTTVKIPLVGGTEYTVRVIATAATYEDSDPSTEVTGTPYAISAPGIPGNVMVMALIDSLQVSWDAATDADGYKVQWKSGDDDYDSATREETTTGTSVKIPLVGGIEYTVRVIATRTNAPDGAASAEMTGTPTMRSISISSTNPSPLNESDLHGAEITLTLSNSTFASSLATTHFELVTTISGLSISTVKAGTGGTAETVLTLSFTPGDFSSAQTLAVKVLAAGHDGNSDLTSAQVTVNPATGVIVSESSLNVEGGWYQQRRSRHLHCGAEHSAFRWRRSHN